MQTAEIINAVLASLTLLGIIVALSLGVKTLRENRTMQSRQHKNELLNEILNWIMDIAECGFILVDKDLVAFKEATKTPWDMKNYESINLGNLEMGFLKASYRGSYIRVLAQSLSNKLQDAVNEIMKQISIEIDICDKYRVRFGDIPDDLDQFNALQKEWVEVNIKRRPLLTKAIYKGIAEVAKVKMESI